MKALTDRLEWVRLWMVDPQIRQAMPEQAVLDELLAAIAIADALPEISVTTSSGVVLAPGRPTGSMRKPPQRVIARPTI